MQHLVVMSSRTEPLRDAYWIVNGVGRKGNQSINQSINQSSTRFIFGNVAYIQNNTNTNYFFFKLYSFFLNCCLFNFCRILW